MKVMMFVKATKQTEAGQMPQTNSWFRATALVVAAFAAACADQE
jgi:hypothetical protein